VEVSKIKVKLGILFAGQGAQYQGMGKSLYESSAAAKNVFDEAGEQIKNWCFSGTKEELKQTQVTQPCVYTATMAAYEAFIEAMSKFDKGFWDPVEVSGVAGFSLGEYSALTAAGVIEEIGQGLEIVKKRGELMLSAGTDGNGNPKGGMIAAFGERKQILDCVESARAGGVLEGVNFNHKAQTVVAGENDAVLRFKQLAAEYKLKTIPLSVSTAFHSPMMEPAAESLREILLRVDMKAPVCKIYCNLTGDDMFSGIRLADGEITKHVSDIMTRQAKSPVYWQETIENMTRDGINTFIEIGPGTTLCGFVRKTSHDAVALNIEDKESLESTVKTLAEKIAAKGEI
jgi:[acyl-carrier-protein] S-malonyltransferase